MLKNILVFMKFRPNKSGTLMWCIWTLFLLGCCEIWNQIFCTTWRWSTLCIMFTCECRRQETCTLWPVNMRMHNCITNILPTLNFTQYMSGTYTSWWNSTTLQRDSILHLYYPYYHLYLMYSLNLYVLVVSHLNYSSIMTFS